MALICPFWTSHVKTVEACPMAGIPAVWVDEDHDVLFGGITIDRIGTEWVSPVGFSFPEPYAGTTTTGWVANVANSGPTSELRVIVDAGAAAEFVDWAFVGANMDGEVTDNSLMASGLTALVTVGTKTVLAFNAISTVPFESFVARVGTYQLVPSIDGSPSAPLTLHVKHWYAPI